MNKKLVTPFITWLLFLVIDLSALAKGIAGHENWRITVAGLALVVVTGFLYITLSHTAKELKPVRVRK